MKKTIITPHNNLLNLNLSEIISYRDLLFLFVKRDFISVYKQTILGPAWFFIQPILTTIIFTVIFGTIASIPTDGIPQILFYMSGIVCWNYFADCLNKTANTFTSNATIFGKVYFPRLIIPMSIVISNLIKFGIQFFLFFLVFIYYYLSEVNINPNLFIFLFPAIVITMAGLGMGFGIIISSITTKYRDFQFLVTFGVQLLMYATPIVYPLSLANEKLGSSSWITLLNPMTPLIETMRYSFLGQGIFSWDYLICSFVFMVILLFFGIVIFNKVEKSFMDTV